MPLERSARRPRLAPLQRWFFAQLQAGVKTSAPSAVLDTPQLSARQRLRVYAEMYDARLVEALRLEFPRLHQAVGEGRFARLARAYLARYPSRHPTIQDVGDRLPRFLASERAAGKLGRLAFAPDLARLERAGSLTFYAADEGPLLTREHLQAVAAEAWPNLTFQVVPSLRVLRLGYAFPRGAAPVAGPTALRVWKRHFEVFEAPLDRREAAALRALTRGAPFAEVAYAAGDASRAATYLATWIAEGLLLA